MIIILFCILYVGEKFTNKNLKIHQLYLTRMIHFVVNSFRKVVGKKYPIFMSNSVEPSELDRFFQQQL